MSSRLFLSSKLSKYDLLCYEEFILLIWGTVFELDEESCAKITSTDTLKFFELIFIASFSIYMGDTVGNRSVISRDCLH